VASAGQPSDKCVSHSIRCWEAARFSTLVSDILHLPREAGQPCHSNIKHMWNRPGQNRPTHTHRAREGSQNHTGLSQYEPRWQDSIYQDSYSINCCHIHTKLKQMYPSNSLNSPKLYGTHTKTLLKASVLQEPARGFISLEVEIQKENQHRYCLYYSPISPPSSRFALAVFLLL